MFTNTVLKVYVPTQLFVAHHVKQFTKRTEGHRVLNTPLLPPWLRLLSLPL